MKDSPRKIKEASRRLCCGFLETSLHLQRDLLHQAESEPPNRKWMLTFHLRIKGSGAFTCHTAFCSARSRVCKRTDGEISDEEVGDSSQCLEAIDDVDDERITQNPQHDDGAVGQDQHHLQTDKRERVLEQSLLQMEHRRSFLLPEHLSRCEPVPARSAGGWGPPGSWRPRTPWAEGRRRSGRNPGNPDYRARRQAWPRGEAPPASCSPLRQPPWPLRCHRPAAPFLTCLQTACKQTSERHKSEGFEPTTQCVGKWAPEIHRSTQASLRRRAASISRLIGY